MISISFDSEQKHFARVTKFRNLKPSFPAFAEALDNLMSSLSRLDMLLDKPFIVRAINNVVDGYRNWKICSRA